MPVSVNATVSVPYINKPIELVDKATGLVDMIMGKVQSGRSRVSQDVGTDRLSAHAKSAKHSVNLAGMQRAAAQPSKAQRAADAGRAAQTPAGRAQAGAGPGGWVAAVPTRKAPKADLAVRADALVAGARSLGQEAEALRGKQRAVHTAAGLKPFGDVSEAGLRRSRNEMHAKTGALLETADAMLAEAGKQGAPDEVVSKLKDARREILTAVLATEYPQAVGAALDRFHGSAPTDASPLTASESFKSLDRELHGFLVTWSPVGDADAGAHCSPDTLKRLDDRIERLERREQSWGLSETDGKVLNYLREVKTAVNLRLELDAAVVGLEALHERANAQHGDDPTPKAGIASLCKQFAHYGSVSKDAASNDPERNLRSLEVVHALADCLAANVVDEQFHQASQDPGVRALLTDLRVAQYREQAAMTYGGRHADAAALAALGRSAAKEARAPTPEEIKGLLPPEHHAGFDAAMEKAEVAVRVHEAYDDAYRGIERVLGSDKALSYKPAVWLKVGTPPAPGEARSGDVLRAEAKLKELGRQNPQAAFLVANLAILEHQVALLEANDVGRAGYEGLEVAAFDPERVMQLAGITTEQMEKLGYSKTEAEQFPEHLQKLSRNFASVEELNRHITYIHNISRETLTSKAVQKEAASLATASPSSLGRLLQHEYLNGAAALGRIGTPEGSPRTASTGAPAATDADVVEGFQAMSQAVARGVVDNDAIAPLLSKQVFEYFDDCLVVMTDVRSNQDARLMEARRDLHAAGVTEGLELDPVKPAGLESAKRILTAIALDTEVMRLEAEQASPDLIRDKRAERDAALDSLRGFSVDTMRRPWQGKIASLFGKGDQPDMATLRSLRATAENIVFVREGFAAERAEVDTMLGTLVEQRHALAEARMAADPRVMGTVQQMIRAAVVSNWPEDNVARRVEGGRVVDAFEPALHRAAIEDTLKTWGLDTEAFGPEISMVLNGTLEKHDLAAWREETKAIDRATGLVIPPKPSIPQRIIGAVVDKVLEKVGIGSPAATASASKPADTPSVPRRVAGLVKTNVTDKITVENAKQLPKAIGQWLVNKKERDQSFQNTFLALGESLQVGDKFDFTSGYQIMYSSRTKPVEPSGTVKLREMMAAAGISNIVLERSEAGFKVTVGGGVRGQAEAQVYASHGLGMGTSAGGSVKLGGGASYIGGYTETFPDTPEGRIDFSTLLTRMATGRRPEGKLFENVGDATVSHQLSGQAVGGVNASAGIGLTASDFGDGDPLTFGSDRLGLDFTAGNAMGASTSVSADVAASLGGKLRYQEGRNLVVWETEREITGSVQVGAQANLKGPKIGQFATPVVDAVGDGLKEGARSVVEGFGTGFVQDKLTNALKPEDRTSDGSKPRSVDMPVLSVGAGATATRTQRMRQEYAVSATGTQHLARAEVVRRTNALLGAENTWIGIGNDDLAERLKTEPNLRRDFDAIKRQMADGEFLQITYTMKADQVQVINDLLDEANDRSKAGDGLRAVAIRVAVRGIVESDASYEVGEVSILSRTNKASKAALGIVALPVVGLHTVAQVGSDTTQISWKVPPRKAA